MIYWKSKTLLVKPEDTYGVDSAPKSFRDEPSRTFPTTTTAVMKRRTARRTRTWRRRQRAILPAAPSPFCPMWAAVRRGGEEAVGVAQK